MMMLYDQYLLLHEFPFSIIYLCECHELIYDHDDYYSCAKCGEEYLNEDSYVDYCEEWYDPDEEDNIYDYQAMKLSRDTLHTEMKTLNLFRILNIINHSDVVRRIAVI